MCVCVCCMGCVCVCVRAFGGCVQTHRRYFLVKHIIKAGKFSKFYEHLNPTSESIDKWDHLSDRRSSEQAVALRLFIALLSEKSVTLDNNMVDDLCWLVGEFIR